MRNHEGTLIDWAAYEPEPPEGVVLNPRSWNRPARPRRAPYRPRAYGDPHPDGTWEGWLVFFPLGGGSPIASGRETTQSTLDALAVWAAGLTPVYVEGALGRALRLAQQPPPIAVLAEAEYEALEDPEQLETAAEADRRAADLDKAAAAAARADAERIRRERLAAEGALAAVEEAAATNGSGRT